MTAETDLLPLVGTLRALPEHVQGVVQAYARANVAHHTAALRAELDESCAVGDKLARLLAETAIVIKGPEPDMTKWSYHDIPDGVRAIQARAERLANDAAKYRWGINNARWIRSEQEAYIAIPVAPDADLSCVAMRDAAIDAAMEGEIKT